MSATSRHSQVQIVQLKNLACDHLIADDGVTKLVLSKKIDPNQIGVWENDKIRNHGKIAMKRDKGTAAPAGAKAR